ncbi:MAG: hypothetical protein NTV11_05445 [Rhodocyclales bacterium]|nr:hypothetical protein [Rhodocyclales bacterium]
MTPAAILKEAMADGVSLTISPAGTIKATGDGAAVSRWLPAIREHKAGIVEALKVGADGTATAPMTAHEEAAIRAWLVYIGENDPATIDVVLNQCSTDADALDYFMRRAGELMP